jgi:hypothetical protein
MHQFVLRLEDQQKLNRLLANWPYLQNHWANDSYAGAARAAVAKSDYLRRPSSKQREYRLCRSQAEV